MRNGWQKDAYFYEFDKSVVILHQGSQYDSRKRSNSLKNKCKLVNKFIIVELEGTYKDQQVQLPKHLRANQKLRHSNEDIVQMHLEHWQSQSIIHFTRKPVSVSDHPYSTEMFPSAQSDPHLEQLCAIPILSSVTRNRARPAPLSAPPPQGNAEINEVTSGPPLLQIG